MEEERILLLEEELLIVRHSGEIPEIALYSSIYYLSEDPEGPKIILSYEELGALQDAALARSREIVLRDLNPANRDLSIYRGLKRSIYNWHRLQDFCRRISRNYQDFQEVVRPALLAFLEQEMQDVIAGDRVSSINCTSAELAVFARILKCDLDECLPGWQSLCCNRSL